MLSFLSFIIFILFSYSFSAPLKIEVTQGYIKPEPIAVVDFYNPDQNIPEIGRNVAEVITNNLRNSGLFEIINSGAFLQTPESIAKEGVRFGDWRVLKSHFLVSGSTEETASGKITINFRLHDVVSGKEIEALSVTGDQGQWRRIAHKISDLIFTRVTGESGVFDSHILYVETVGKITAKKVTKRLMQIDQDGENPFPLTRANTLLSTPRYSNNGLVAYLSYEEGKPQVFVLDLKTREHRKLGKFKGMTFAPRFSPEGDEIIMSFEKNGKSAIYRMNLQEKILIQITPHKSIDTSPCFSHDKKHIVFTSNRDGKEHLYIMDYSGKNVRRLSYGDGKYSQPVWSPRGDLIAFTKQKGKRFYIGVIPVSCTDGSEERLIAEGGYLVEAPSWAPNGRYIAFTKQSGALPNSAKIHIVDLTGRSIRMLQTPKNAADASWSNLLTAKPK